MRICLVNPPLFNNNLYEKWDLSLVDTISPPLGLLLLAGVVRRAGHSISLVDAYSRGLSLAEAIENILGNNPDVVGISATTPLIYGAAEIARLLKAACPEIKIIIGGAHITAVPEETFESFPQFDFGVSGEGEETLIELLSAFSSHKNNFETIKGIIYRKDGSVFKTENRPFLTDMDSLPLPAWDILPSLTKPYRMSIVGTISDNSTALITSRGCPGHCNFCDTSVFGNKFRPYSSEYVIKMFVHLIENYGIKEFLLYDDNFITDRKRLKKICELLIQNKYGITWSCSARVNMVEPDMLKLMKAAGCWQIEYGIESGSQRILDHMGKEIKLRQIETALKCTKQAGIKTRGNFIFGYLNETRETLEESIRFCLKVDLDYFQQTFLTPYPGSQIYHEADKYGRFDKSLEKMNNLTINFVPHGLTEEDLRYYSRKAFRAFYFRPKIIFCHIMKIKNIRDISRLKASFVALLKTVFNKYSFKKLVQDKNKVSVSVKDVKKFWEEHPLLSYELSCKPGSQEFFNAYDEIREKIEFKYCFPLLRLSDVFVGQKVLDVGCGNGWLLSQYAKRGANINGIDLTFKAIEISSRRFILSDLKGSFVNASAEEMPFHDNTFDVVTSLGVIHHTPKTELCVNEIIRVCKPGGRILIAVYYENILVTKWFYPITRLIIYFLGRKDLHKLNRQQFINYFDGKDNPLGKVYSKGQVKKLLKGLKDMEIEVHYFPKRFIPKLARYQFSGFIDRFLDRRLGFLIYISGYKPKENKGIDRCAG